MLEKLDHFLNIITGSFVGVFMGNVLFVFWDYKMYPELYAMQSAPWYTGILVDGIFIIVLLTVVSVIKLVIWKRQG